MMKKSNLLFLCCLLSILLAYSEAVSSCSSVSCPRFLENLCGLPAPGCEEALTAELAEKLQGSYIKPKEHPYHKLECPNWKQVWENFSTTRTEIALFVSPPVVSFPALKLQLRKD
ncbi:hypothetical protein GUITHDRAFT_151236 [Guillardia theta CCMP2712]|uniref:Uncharacterized protein n=1 Tax=Guillardia theta (strain CCMP2712) TaxID=905079 RepID=L1JQ08_GUITC|nr:hypothetical protein GUITHDRAFT_151236 [Guillardia theta CCMP2712]EKX50163.1 hypothetical protein GUITHDRAFT_151236 [Guillardia theta CCMP2712]|mmetsp:Transcript_44864/g.141273  ORF Transcript_44864/g.141273 Transcript_44864/m.141273 type:complete len:115 (-) Transcript_44864:147-491(-)|eukprot:XP_005837143.1 hypothetical protein GUITHDRAFT_151236 [Guillardia theta CCMP2712]